MGFFFGLPDIKVRDVLHNTGWQTMCDFAFVKKNGYHLKWYFHIPFYRLAQEVGLYIGGRSAGSRRHNERKKD
jgi:hypothetical protein